MEFLNTLEMTSNQLITATIAALLIIDGLIKKTRKPPAEIRGCLYGDAAHEKLTDMLSDLHDADSESQKWHKEMHERSLEMLLIMRRLDK